MGATGVVTDENELENFIEKMKLFNESMDISYELIKNLYNSVSTTKQWVNYGQQEMQAYLELLLQYHKAISGEGSDSEAPTWKMYKHLTKHSEASQVMEIVFCEP